MIVVTALLVCSILRFFSFGKPLTFVNEDDENAKVHSLLKEYAEFCCKVKFKNFSACDRIALGYFAFVPGGEQHPLQYIKHHHNPMTTTWFSKSDRKSLCNLVTDDNPGQFAVPHAMIGVDVEEQLLKRMKTYADRVSMKAYPTGSLYMYTFSSPCTGFPMNFGIKRCLYQILNYTETTFKPRNFNLNVGFYQWWNPLMKCGEVKKQWCIKMDHWRTTEFPLLTPTDVTFQKFYKQKRKFLPEVGSCNPGDDTDSWITRNC